MDNSLWYKLYDIFYYYKCHDGFIDTEYSNKYSFEKDRYRYSVVEKEDTIFVLTKTHIITDYVEYTALFKTLNELKEKFKEELN